MTEFLTGSDAIDTGTDYEHSGDGVSEAADLDDVMEELDVVQNNMTADPDYRTFRQEMVNSLGADEPANLYRCHSLN